MEVIALLAVVLLLFVFQGQLYKRLGLARLNYDCKFGKDEVFDTDELELTETVSNEKWLPLPWLRAEFTSSVWLDFAQTHSTVTGNTRFVPSFFTIGGNQKITRRWKVKCKKRGVYVIDTVMLSTSDLLGQYQLARKDGVNTSLCVLPTPLPLDEFVSARHLQGDTVVRKNYYTDPFYVSGVREYSGSDPLNRVHWPATAKVGRLMVKNNDYTTDQNILLILNVQSAEHERTAVVNELPVEKAISACAAVCRETVRNNTPVSFMCNAQIDGEELFVQEGGGIDHVMELLRLFARIPLESPRHFPDYLDRNFDKLSSSDVVVVTPYMSEKLAESLRRIIAFGNTVKVYLTQISGSVIPDDIDVYCLNEAQSEAGYNLGR